jgi:hypothetical protein
MKKLVLHSDQIKGKTQLDEESLHLFESLKPKIAYTPSQNGEITKEGIRIATNGIRGYFDKQRFNNLERVEDTSA